ncbi:uncharacterized protein [Rutidosis leptorrhynchoides]|uniref:uncharacterized protein isoform X2 n=1 Tax=Rutidosis leptorrhynchoides TaxID=125765 RepID=UPI003A99A434
MCPHAFKTMMKRRILVSNLRLFTKYSDVCDYFENVLEENPSKVIMNSFNTMLFNRSATVTVSSVDAANRILNHTPHMINGAVVTVQRYDGVTQKFLRGESME